MNKSSEINTGRAIISIVSSILVLIAAQLVSLLVGNGIIALGALEAVGNVAAAILYPLLTLLGLKQIGDRILKHSLKDLGIATCTLSPFWCICAILMPGSVVLGSLLVPGHWENPVMNPAQLAKALTGAVLFTGSAVGFVEEAVFRGVIMKVLEMRWNKRIAIIVPSVTFGVLHAIGTGMDLVSFLQLVIGGSVVGILFSLVTYGSGNIGSSAFMHSVWNMCMGSGILYISTEMSEGSIFNYVLDTDSFLITGGDFGVDASCISIAAYLVFIILALIYRHRNGQGNGRRPSAIR